MRIHIGRKDIAIGIQGDGKMCPLALAADRAARRLGYGATVVTQTAVSFISIITRRSNNFVFRPLPMKARNFIRSYDDPEDSMDFKPFWFEVRDLPKKEAPATPA